MTYEEREELGIFSIDERLQPTLPGVEESSFLSSTGSDVVADPKSIPSVDELVTQMEMGIAPPAPISDISAEMSRPEVKHSDAPMCMQCGVQMVRAGSCHACPSCGNTSGCS
jgi:ribonucleoside-diphosphate reductase alpha chain